MTNFYMSARCHEHRDHRLSYPAAHVDTYYAKSQACFQQELAQRSVPISKGGNQTPPLPPCCRCLEQVYRRCALESGRRSVLAQQSRAGFSAESRALQLLTQACKNTAGRTECSQQCQSLSRGQGSQGRTLTGVLHGQGRAEAAQTPLPVGLLQPIGLSSPKQGSGSDIRQNTLSCLLRQGRAQLQLSSWHRRPWLAAQLHPAARAFPNSVNTSWGLFITELSTNVSPCRASSPSSWAALRVTLGR